MANDYTQWPLEADVNARLAAAGLVLRTSQEGTDRIQSAIDEVTAEVARRTGRQFVADSANAPTTRYYDGSGTATLEIDEYVTFVSAFAVGLQADPGFPLSNVYPVMDLNKPQWQLLRGQGGLPAFQSAGVYQPLPTIFPAGRRNIAVTAQFGYAAAIPPDLWNHVCGEIGRRVAVEALFQVGGRLQAQQSGDERQGFTLADVDALGWQAPFEADMKQYYRRPLGRRLRSLKPVMI